MAARRNAWAKIDVGMGRHPKLVTRPDCDRLLWLCLLLHAKEHSPGDGVIRGLDAAMMRGLWAIKAPLAKVQEALAYFIAAGMMFLHRDGYLIKDFVERQRVGGDTPEAHAARQAAYVHRKKTVSMTSPMTSAMTSNDRRHSDAEVEKEKEDVLVAIPHQASVASVEDLRAKAKDLPEFDRLQVHKLLDVGRVAEASAMLEGLDDLRRKARSG